MSKQTAVEWLQEKLLISLSDELKCLNGFFVIAKEMEKEQMILFYLKGCDDTYGIDEPCPVEDYDRKEAEEYYNETFKNENNVR